MTRTITYPEPPPSSEGFEQPPLSVVLDAARLYYIEDEDQLNLIVQPWVSPSPIHAGVFIIAVADLSLRLAAYTGHRLYLGGARSNTGGTEAVAMANMPLAEQVMIGMFNEVSDHEPEKALRVWAEALHREPDGDWPGRVLARALTVLGNVVWTAQPGVDDHGAVGVQL